MEQAGSEGRRWKTTVIVSTSLQNHEVAYLLSNQQHRIRYSECVEAGSVIFPLSGVAFMIIDTMEFSDMREEAGVFEKIEKFLHVHRNSFLLLVASLYGEKEWKVLSTIQQRFLGSSLRILPVHNSTEITRSMTTIAQVTSKPSIDSVRDRISLARAHIIDQSPMWEVLRKMQFDCE
ncbi:protein SPO16 homolog [Erpetoichthys calabaricus]|uniref:protein SPO16 homolog n=1 Tax=Erpetoichthys calabaricus TaxID=27687 RepID=UPI0010A09B4C|nr:protein SPO16 homolog [Erpetoichthys calabaricus]